LIINDEIEVTVVDVKGKSAKLGISFPKHATVLRREVYERIQAENREAAAGAGDLADALAARGGAGALGTAPRKADTPTGDGSTGDGADTEPKGDTEDVPDE
jgi:carbon storage regulator